MSPYIAVVTEAESPSLVLGFGKIFPWLVSTSEETNADSPVLLSGHRNNSPTDWNKTFRSLVSVPVSQVCPATQNQQDPNY